MTTPHPAIQNAQLIQKQTDGFTPKLGLVLGSGLGKLAEQIEKPHHFAFTDLQGFTPSQVKGHAGKLTLGHLHGIPVCCLQGRPHYYEGNSNEIMRTPMRTMKALGCDTVLLTNAAASLRHEVPPGSLVAITDHINFSFHNPLIGPNDDEFGTRFPGMEDAYDPELRAQLHTAAKQSNITLHEGVYLGVLGPSYETVAEIRAFKMLGADAVGMSTVPEVIVARHCGLKVATISTITNYGCGLSEEKLTHNNVLKVAQQASNDLIRLLQTWMEHLATYA